MSLRLLTAKQRSMLTQIAARGWRKMTESKAIDEPFDDWRTREAIAACGFRISAAPRSAFDALFEHFKVISGAVEQAFESALGPDNERRQWLHKIRRELARASLSEGYVVQIAKDKFKTADLEKLTIRQLQALFFDVARAVGSRLAATHGSALLPCPSLERDGFRRWLGENAQSHNLSAAEIEWYGRALDVLAGLGWESREASFGERYSFTWLSPHRRTIRGPSGDCRWTALFASIKAVNQWLRNPR